MQRKKIAYLKRKLFSYSNVRTSEQIQRLFPEFEIDEIDIVNDLLRKHKLVVAINIVCVILRYWREILSRRQTVDLCFYRTPYIFRKIRELVRKRIEPHIQDYAFSLQTQSLYDASTPGLTHFVYTDHTHLTNLCYPGFPRNELFSRKWIDLEQQIYKHADHVFVMSEHVRRSLIDQYACAPEKSTCVYAGSNIDTSPVPLANDGYTNHTIVFIGIDWHRKGGPVLVQAFHRLLKEVPDARLIIIGASPSIHHPQIEVIGRASPEDVKTHLVRGSVFCLPTRVEPFGIAVVEAFFHKLPVVTTNIGAMPNLVIEGESGYLVPSDDPDRLAKALIELLRDPEKCRRFGERGCQIVTEQYSWDEVGRRLHEEIGTTLKARELQAT